MAMVLRCLVEGKMEKGVWERMRETLQDKIERRCQGMMMIFTHSLIFFLLCSFYFVLVLSQFEVNLRFSTLNIKISLIFLNAGGLRHPLQHTLQ
jgi:hypothetical protein